MVEVETMEVSWRGAEGRSSRRVVEVMEGVASRQHKLGATEEVVMEGTPGVTGLREGFHHKLVSRMLVVGESRHPNRCTRGQPEGGRCGPT